MLKQFVCLAKSARERGLCIAGKEILANGRIGNWFRPIGSTEEALPARDCTFSIGHIVTCEVSEHTPSPTQSENHKVAPQPKWQTVGGFPKQKIASLVDSPLSLWDTGFGCSSRHGENDKVSQVAASISGNSLYFIRIAGGTLTKKDESFEENQRAKIRLTFSYNDETYSFAVTDPAFSGLHWNNLQIGESIEIAPCYITVSLAQPFNGYCYKLVAGYVSI